MILERLAGVLGALPSPPTADELRRHTPTIGQAPAGTPRPRWSVMIPTYNCAGYLRRALDSVLRQDPGADTMDIDVVDDCSTADDPAAVVAELAPDRVRFIQHEANCGATATFNTCLQHARGHWVHLLHGDDFVLEGFYRECEQLIRGHPAVVMIGGKVVTVDEDDRWLALIGPDARFAGGIYPDFVRQQAVEQLFQFAGVAVRRDAYERTGGFCTFFRHVADWDMWFRIGQLGPVACTRRPYGAFRLHAASDTNLQKVGGTNVLEEYLCMRINLARLSPAPDGDEAARWRKRVARRAYRNARKFRAAGSVEGRLNQARWAFRLDPSPKTLNSWLAAWLAHALRTARASRPEVA